MFDCNVANSSASAGKCRMDCHDIIDVFDGLFRDEFSTRLCGGAEEPIYLPARAENEPHRVYFRADYLASALHEAAHWCIAGPERRRLRDYGYWYEPDGRNAQQQRQFEQLEARPQALEWLFSRAAGLPFRVSIDNLADGGQRDDFPFQLAVWQALQAYLNSGLPERAERFRQGLAARFGGPDTPRSRDYQLDELLFGRR